MLLDDCLSFPNIFIYLCHGRQTPPRVPILGGGGGGGGGGRPTHMLSQQWQLKFLHGSTLS